MNKAHPRLEAMGLTYVCPVCDGMTEDATQVADRYCPRCHLFLGHAAMALRADRLAGGETFLRLVWAELDPAARPPFEAFRDRLHRREHESVS